jgi:hypothetical protein
MCRLEKENIDRYTARFNAEKIWNELGSRDIRDIIKVCPAMAILTT